MTLTESIKPKIDLLLYIFIGISFISSQLSIALSSIGVAGVIILFILKLIIEKKLPEVDKMFFYLLAVFFIWQLISSILSKDPALSVTGTLKKASLYFIPLCSIAVLSNRDQIKKYFVILFIFSAVVSAYEIIRYIFDFRTQDVYSLGDFRIRYFGYPITIGEIKMLILIIMAPFILSSEKLIMQKWVLILLALPVLISLYLTNTRNAILGLFIAFAVIGIVKNRFFLMGFIIVLVIFLYTAPMQYKERILSIVDLNHPSNKERFTMWKVGESMIKDKPVFGFGDVDFLEIYTTYKKPEAYGEGSHMHNNFIHLAVLYGIPGLIIWLALMMYIFFKQIKIYSMIKNDEFLNIIVLTSISAMFAFIVSGQTEWNFGDAEFAVVLWFILSLPFIALKINLSDKIG